ncbi:uncharacterized protein LOC119728040 [Patiria miniata]|uniref:CABIT domain-containing protein n=1 Tax=Patiria miniata TaxID=46514 RepID=A0A913ZWX6_PATMI|nr:uncharacterized protein LOC119728040 [Patiria miniata]
MAASDTPESLLSFVEKHKSQLPAVVEIADGIYGSIEKDSEVRDFSRGDILRILTVKEEVNITFDSVYAGPSKKGLLTVDRHFSESQFEVLSSFKDGYVYKTLDQMILDFPEYIRAVKPDKDLNIKVGDRLKLLTRSTLVGRPSIQCKNVRSGRTVKLSGDLKDSFAKKIDKSHIIVSLDSIYERLPQRVRLVHDEGQRIRGKFHGIPGLDPDFNGEMNLSKIEVVEACPWEHPDRVIQIPVTTDVFVYPRKDWGKKIGPVVDVHELAKVATPASMKVAVVVDDESTVPGCPKDTILLVCNSQTSDYAIAKGRGGTGVLIPKTYPSLFKVLGNTWSTVEDLLQARICKEVHVETTYKVPEELDNLYQHDVVRLTSFEPEPYCCPNDDCEVVQMDRSRSLVGEVGTITVPTFAKANFHDNAKLLGDCAVSKILALSLPLEVTLSRPNVSPQSQELADANDDVLINMSPLKIIGQRQFSVTVCQLLNTNQQTSGDDDMIYIPAFSKLQVRSITQPTIDVHRRDELPSLNTNILRISERQLNSFKEQTYEQIPPPVPRRVDERHETMPVVSSGKPPPRPPKPIHLIQATQQDKDKEVPSLPPRKDQSSPLSPRKDQSSPSPTRTSKRPSLVTTILAGVNRDLTQQFDLFTDKEVGKEGVRVQDETPDYEVTRPCHSAEYETDSDGDDYERPGDGYEKPGDKSPLPGGKEVPPKDGNISAYGLSDMVRLLQYLKVGRQMVDTFRSKGIDGKTLCDLSRKGNDESLQMILGVDDFKDWLALKCFIMQSLDT